MTIDRTYPIFTVRWLAVHGLAAVPTPTKTKEEEMKEGKELEFSYPNERVSSLTSFSMTLYV